MHYGKRNDRRISWKGQGMGEGLVTSRGLHNYWPQVQSSKFVSKKDVSVHN